MPNFLALYTMIHVAISLVAIYAGFVVFYNMLRARESERFTAEFLIMTILTSLTGFGFPVNHITPAHIFGVLSLIALGLATYGKYSRHFAGKWRSIYVVTSLFSLYLNVVVLIVQSFQKILVLRSIAPTQTEPVFLAIQGLALAAFIGFGIRAVFCFGVKPAA